MNNSKRINFPTACLLVVLIALMNPNMNAKSLPSSSSSSSSCSWPNSLPISMYLEIKKYLSLKGYWKLLITSKILFENIRYETRQLHLQLDSELLLFINDEIYRMNILKKIKNPYHQLQLTGNSISYELFQQFCSLDLNCDVNFTFRNNIDIFPSPNNHEKDHDHSLTLNLNNYRRVFLQSNIRIKDFDGLNKVQEMKLVQLPNLISVNNLKNLRKLTLISCHNIIDISCLHQLSHVTIASCDGITSTVGLGNIHYLYLHNLINLKSLDPRTKNQYLHITNCSQINDLIPLRAVQHLSTDLMTHSQHCEIVLNENEIIRSITLINYQEMEPHPHLQHLQSVTFILSSIINVKYLQNVPILSFRSCKNLSNIRNLMSSNPKKVKSISFFDCDQMSDYHSLQNISSSIRISTSFVYKNLFPYYCDFSKLSNTYLLSFESNYPDSTQLSLKGVSGVHHLTVKNFWFGDLPQDLSSLELSSDDFNDAVQSMLIEANCSRIILKGGVYKGFIKEFYQHQNLQKKIQLSSSSSPYEFFDDLIENQGILLKNKNYQKPKGNVDSFFFNLLEGVFSHLFGVLPAGCYYGFGGPPDTQSFSFQSNKTTTNTTTAAATTVNSSTSSSSFTFSLPAGSSEPPAIPSSNNPFSTPFQFNSNAVEGEDSDKSKWKFL